MVPAVAAESKITRYPAVAGMFYEADEKGLRQQIEWSFKHPVGPGKLPEKPVHPLHEFVGYVSPHAGYLYSGPVAAHSYYRLSQKGVPETIVIAGPNHTGLGSMVSVMVEGSWMTPLGRVEIDSEFAEALVKHSRYADPDTRAHIHEHSVEVQIPFLQYIYGDSFRIVPIVMLTQMLRTSEDLASAIIRAADETGRKIVFIASSDFSHYVPYSEAYRRDKHAIDAIIRLDAPGLFEAVEKYEISMCGPGPVATLILLAKHYGGTGATLLKYATSGDTSGDRGMVVGYASIEAPA